MIFYTNGLVWFYGISTIVGYLMSNPVYSYILNIWFVNKSTKLNGSKYCYVWLISVICLHTVQWSNSSTSNNTI